MKRLGGNSMSDKLGNKYFIKMQVYGRTQVIEYASRYLFLENLEYCQEICPNSIVSHSNTDSSNVNEYALLPDDVITKHEVDEYNMKRKH